MALAGTRSAAKGAKTASSALLGDFYTRRWTTPKKGKKPAVEHELKFNAVSVGLGVIAAGATALMAGAALWMMQKKPKTTKGRVMYRILEYHEPTYKTITVSVPHTTYIRVPGFDEPVEKTVYVDEEREVIDQAEHWIVYTQSGIRLWKSDDGWWKHAITRREFSQGWYFVEIEKEIDNRKWYKFKNDNKYTIGTEDRKGFLVSD